MQRKVIYSLVIGLLLPLLPLAGYGWGPTGHRVVAEIAYQHLTPKARKQIDAIIGRQPLAMIANWPDFIKSDTTHKYDGTSRWHYVDFPAACSRVAFDSLLKSYQHENLYTQSQAMMQQLKQAKLTHEQQLFSLSFLVHLIGDMHMPLHVGRDEDQGGNKIKVYWFDKPSNLHRVWDEDLIDFQQLSYTEYSKALDVVSPEEVKALQKGSMQDWMFESHELAEVIYSKTKPEDKLSYRYNYWFLGDLNKQLLKGGLRLAALLNETFK
ncbi:S1/P1 nuclease [Chitinophaga pendula]|uniref:S1/P1 nuclease n=1 Tax=Chitinophaga TaxID=79328 RepID=UPI000BAFDE93|nr:MULTISPECIES: S1/P1 nuclease [Chitinophaga]ASZ10154.1 S1/P1 Nuclease [Chitinophaga sp. MD30]UCJ06892.1 S1/P1 nuclease [Chitinophaga pendula]